MNPNIDESRQENEKPWDLVKRLALSKAQEIAKTVEKALIIGSDQVATFNEQVIGKPLTHEEAVKQLSLFSGQKVIFYTGLCLLNTETKQHQTISEPFSVFFRLLSHQKIENYLHIEQPYQCAGSFKSEGLGICLFEKLEGNDPNSLIGLPLIQLINMLTKEGITVPLEKNTTH